MLSYGASISPTHDSADVTVCNHILREYLLLFFSLRICEGLGCFKVNIFIFNSFASGRKIMMMTLYI